MRVSFVTFERLIRSARPWRDRYGPQKAAGRAAHRIASCCSSLWGLLILLATTATAATPQGARESITTTDLRRHASFLASDTLEGRAAGSQGGRAAAAYLAMEFANAGLNPAADGDDFLQPFRDGCQNLLGVVAGSDPDRKHEVIIVSGHFDHVGLGNLSNSFGPFGQIHNGADDNASGTAAVLEVAEAVASLDPPLRRTVLFALWDAEEGGLIGSKHWLKHPTVELQNVRLMINCDMVGRLRNNVLVAYGTRTAAGLRQHLAEANPSPELKFNFDWRQRDDSDHWPFFEQNIPYLLLHTGDHTDYHRPSDDVDKLNYDGLAMVSQLLFNFTCQVANAETSLTFREASRDEHPRHKRQAEVVPAAPSPRLGLSWSNARQPGEPFVVTRVEHDTPAAVAGFRVGDRITSFSGRTADGAEELVDLVLAAPEQTTAVVERAGREEPLRLEVTLRGTPIRIGVTWKEDDAEPGVAIVTSVMPGSPAAVAGIEPLDRLVPPSDSHENDTQWLSELSDENEVTLRRDRRGQLVTLTLRPLAAAAAEF